MGKQLANAEYNHDFYIWAMRNAQLLREGKFTDIDVHHIAEEIESMGKRDKRQMVNRLIILLIHLLKWEFQPDKRSGSWKGSITEQRRRIFQVLEDSPSLYKELKSKTEYAYQEAVRQAADETGLNIDVFPKECPYSEEQLLNSGFYPDGIQRGIQV